MLAGATDAIQWAVRGRYQESTPPGRRGPMQQREEAGSHDTRGLRSGKVSECRREVDVENEMLRVGGRLALCERIVTDEEGDMDRLFVRDDLLRPSVFSVQVPVVGHEHEEGAGEPARLRERVFDL